MRQVWGQSAISFKEFLKFDFFPRVGGGIGMTRMIAALDKLHDKRSCEWREV